MDCALMEKLSANLIEFMLVTDDPEKLAECHRVYHNLQMKLSEKEQPSLARQIILPTRRLEPKPRKNKQVHRTYRTPNRLAQCNL